MQTGWDLMGVRLNGRTFTCTNSHFSHITLATTFALIMTPAPASRTQYAGTASITKTSFTHIKKTSLSGAVLYIYSYDNTHCFGTLTFKGWSAAPSGGAVYASLSPAAASSSSPTAPSTPVQLPMAVQCISIQVEAPQLECSIAPSRAAVRPQMEVGSLSSCHSCAE